MTRRLVISTALVFTAACQGDGRAERPASGGLGVLVSTSDDEAGLGDDDQGVLLITGEVTGLGYTQQSNALAGYGSPTEGVLLTNSFGEVWALGWELTLGDDDLAETPDVQLGETVTLTLSVERPWSSYEGVMLEDDDGLVLGGVSGRMQPFGLQDYLTVADGSVVGGTFEHECGEGRRMELDVTAETSASVATGESAEVEVGGAPMTFFNLAAWQHQDVSGMMCLDWSVPYSWAVQR